jgi:hypothetical protein
MMVSEMFPLLLKGKDEGQGTFWLKAIHEPTGVSVEWPNPAGTMNKFALIEMLEGNCPGWFEQHREISGRACDAYS